MVMRSRGVLASLVACWLIVTGAEALGESESESSETPVRQELHQLRSRFGRQFAIDDGRRLAEISSVPLHYQGADGSWHEIDLGFKRAANNVPNVPKNVPKRSKRSKDTHRNAYTFEWVSLNRALNRGELTIAKRENLRREARS